VQLFTDGWRVGATRPHWFFEHFGARLMPDAVLIQPLSPVFRGPPGLRKLFEPAFRIMPDLRGEIVRWGATQDGLFIELLMHGTLGGRTAEWTTVDQLVLRGNLIAARRSYFDPLPLIVALLSRPSAVVKLLLLTLVGRSCTSCSTTPAFEYPPLLHSTRRP
jgi:hypothetical protein